MKPITFTATSYQFDGVPAYLYGGEFHYFRVPRADWRRRMQLFKEAGGNVLATYIPWLLHEPEEGRFVWGETAAYLDLEGFLQTAREEGLYVLARPGPYQYSELIYDGLPGWLCENYPDLLARNRRGQVFRNSSVSYVHPLFWEKVRRWFDAICPILAPYTLSRGGPIAFTQIDNEMIGIHEWFGGLDYNPVAMGFGQPDGRFPRWLRARYQRVADLNAHYGTAYPSFAAVEPPPEGGDDEHTIRRRKDYFHFYLTTVAEYARFLVDQFRAHGIDTPIVHNSANPGMNAYFLETISELGAQFLLGSDHYYNLDQTWAQNHPTPQYAVRCFLSLEELRLMGYPPTVFELPGGSCSNWPPITPSDALACYLTNLAFGMKGHNYYVFTGGPNPPGAGTHTDVYDYDAGIGANGEIRPLYAAQKAFGQVTAAHPWLATAARQVDFRIALDFEYSRAGHYWAAGGPGWPSPKQAWDILRAGPLTTALCAGLSPEMVRLDGTLSGDGKGADALPLVVVAAASMAVSKQQAIVNFLKAGGKALILPVLPWLDDDLRPCTLLADYLGASRPSPAPAGVTRASIGGVMNIRGEVANLWDQLPSGARIVGIEERSGKPIAWAVGTAGGGEAMVLSFSWLHAMREQEQMLKAVLGQLGCRPIVQCSNPNVWVTLWTKGEKAVAFMLNLFSAPMDAAVRVCLPDGRSGDAGKHRLAPVTVEVVDFQLEMKA